MQIYDPVGRDYTNDLKVGVTVGISKVGTLLDKRSG